MIITDGFSKIADSSQFQNKKNILQDIINKTKWPFALSLRRRGRRAKFGKHQMSNKSYTKVSERFKLLEIICSSLNSFVNIDYFLYYNEGEFDSYCQFKRNLLLSV